MSSGLKTKILIADDEHIISETLRIILSGQGYDTRATYSGEQAIEIAASFRPDIVIVDVFMGGISGVEAAMQISEGLPGCRVILSSGHYAANEVIEDAKRRGVCFEMLAKPIHPVELIQRLSKESIVAESVASDWRREAAVPNSSALARPAF